MIQIITTLTNEQRDEWVMKSSDSILNYLTVCPNCNGLIQFEEKDINTYRSLPRIMCPCTNSIQLPRKYMKTNNKKEITEDQLYKNKYRIDKYEKALADQDCINQQISKLQKAIDLVNEGVAVYNHMELFSYRDKNNLSDDDLIRFNLSSQTPIIGRTLTTSPITDKEDKEYFRFDMRIAIFHTMIEKYEKVLENIERFKKHILSCDDSEIIYQTNKED